MAILNVIKKDTYSIIDNVSIIKQYKVLTFDLIIYENSDKKDILDRKSFVINSNAICKKVDIHLEEYGDPEKLFDGIRSNLKLIQKDMIEKGIESYNLMPNNKYTLVMLQYLNYNGIYRITLKNIESNTITIDTDIDSIDIVYEEDRSCRYYYNSIKKAYFCYLEDRRDFIMDTKGGIGTDHFFDNNVLPVIREEKNIIKLCYSLVKILDPNLFYDTIDV